MAYIMVESSVRTHHKFLKAGPEASWLWLCGLGYCQEGLTDGFIPTEALRFLGVDKPHQYVDRLVKSRLWEVVEGGWQMHDYLAHNKSADQVRATMRRRASGGYKGGRPAKVETFAETLEVNHEGYRRADAKVSEGETLPETLSYLPTDLPDRPAYRPTDAEPVRVPSRPVGLIDGRALRAHGEHAWCSLPREGLCVAPQLHREFLGKCGRSEAELRQWYAATVQRFEGVGIGEDTFKFWRNQFEAWIGAATQRPVAVPMSRGAQNVAAVTRALEKRLARQENQS